MSAPVPPGPQGLYADLAAVLEVLTEGHVPLDAQAAFCLLVIGHGIILASGLEEPERRQLEWKALGMAEALTPTILQALRGKETP